MASSKQIKKWIAANKKSLTGIQRKIAKLEADLKKAVAEEKKKAAAKKAAKKKSVKKAPAKKKATKRKARKK